MAAAKNPGLRSVSGGVRSLSVSEAAESGSDRELLVAMRSRIAVAVADPDTPPRDLAALTKRLSEVVREIAALDLREAEAAVAAGGGLVADERFDAKAI